MVFKIKEAAFEAGFIRFDSISYYLPRLEQLVPKSVINLGDGSESR